MASVTFDITYMPTIVDKLGLSAECPLVADQCPMRFAYHAMLTDAGRSAVRDPVPPHYDHI
jgi:hypothetical protein